MLKGSLRSFICGICTIATLSSCGGDNLGGGIGEFTTVNASALASTNRLESDLVEGNSCSGTATPGVFATDLVPVSFTSTGQFATGNLNLLISGITVRYTPVPSLSTAPPPALPDFPVNYSRQVAPNSTVSIDVPVIPESYKSALTTRATQNLSACGPDLFEYYVQVIFKVSEVGGKGDVRDVIANLSVAIADRNN